ncbi:MAG: hypothetical protein K5853_06815 [Lachnospiraceae bacterium]|nr:hypothetical protein [Lachnospiraceae bacterium]
MKYVDASYTVEATAIIGMTMVILMSLMLVGFSAYQRTLSEVREYEERDENPVDIFRLTQVLKDIGEE